MIKLQKIAISENQSSLMISSVQKAPSKNSVPDYALTVLTSGFEMRPGVSLSLWPLISNN